MKIQILSIMVVLVVIGSTFASAVETREIEQLTLVTPLYEDDYNTTINWSDPASASLSNYNSTVIPFMEETNVSGTFTGSFMPPILAQVSDSTSATEAWVSCIARFKSDWVMSGSSYSWWRVPIQNISDFSFINLTIWHLDNPSLISITDSSGDPNEATRPMRIYSNLYNPDGEGLVWFNQTVTAWNFEWNFTWLRVVAPIHSDESYYARFVYWHADQPGGQELMFTQSDVGDDQILRSWFYEGEVIEFNGDLDISVIHEYGMGYGVSGFEVPSNATNNVSIKFYSSTSTPIEDGEYLTFMMPFFYDISTSNNVRIYIQDWNTTWYDEWWVAEGDNVTDFTIHSSLWSHSYSCSKFLIMITFYNTSNLLYIWDQFSEFYIYDDDWSAYRENRFYCTNHPWAPDYLYYFHFTPYHALQVSDGEWVNTIIDPVYEIGGKFYSGYKYETVERSYPWYIQILVGAVTIPWALYYFLDKIIFVDALPNLELEDYLNWFSTTAHNLKNNPVVKFIVSIGMYIWEFITFIVKWAPYVLAALLKGLNLFIFIPVWITCILIFNGLKRYFVVMARDGPEAASDYADEFLKNCVKYVKSQPIGRVAGRFR